MYHINWQEVELNATEQLADDAFENMLDEGLSINDAADRIATAYPDLSHTFVGWLRGLPYRCRLDYKLGAVYHDPYWDETFQVVACNDKIGNVTVKTLKHGDRAPAGVAERFPIGSERTHMTRRCRHTTEVDIDAAGITLDQLV